MSAARPKSLAPAWPQFIRRPTQGLEPVGNGQAAAGFSAVLAPGAAPVAGSEATGPIAEATDRTADFPAIFFLGFADLLADFLSAALLVTGFFDDFLLAFLLTALFFFFFFAAFLAFLFFAMTTSIKS
jgi:hypothetical protein